MAQNRASQTARNRVQSDAPPSAAPPAGPRGMDRHRARPTRAEPRTPPGMAHPTLLPTRAAADAPLVRLELRHGAARPTWHDVAGEEFLVGSVPGCDLRIPGTN